MFSGSQPVAEISPYPKYLSYSTFRNLAAALKYVPVFVYSVKQIRFYKFILYSAEEMK